MPIEVNSLEPSDLIEMAKQNGIDLSLDKNGKLEMHHSFRCNGNFRAQIIGAT